MCILYFKPFDLCLFALTSQIVIYQVKQSCNRKTFVQVASHRMDTEFIITCMEAGRHKVSERLLVFLAIQTSKQAKPEMFGNQVVVLEFDQLQSFQVCELARIESSKQPITNLNYHASCGLIMSCYSGFIEVFDPLTFNSLGTWDNYIYPNQ